VFIEPAGGGVPTDEAAITFEPDGSSCCTWSRSPPGRATRPCYRKSSGRALGIDPLRVTLRAGRQDGPVLKGAAAFGSRTTMSQGSVSAEAAKVVIRKSIALAADALEASEADLAYAAGVFRVAGTDRAIALRTSRKRFPGALDSTAELPAPISFPSGAHVAEVEIDPQTGTTDLVRYVSIDDCGVVMNQTLVDGPDLGAGCSRGWGRYSVNSASTATTDRC